MTVCVILAGGMGTRLSEETQFIPKPAIMIGDKPILHHIIDSYLRFSIREFIIPVGYKAHIILGYFASLPDVNLQKSNGKTDVECDDWKISFVETGLNTLTGGRIKRLEKYIQEPFYFTYGDGLSNLDVRRSMADLVEHNSITTLTAVRPIPRFGSLVVDSDGTVTDFGEKRDNLTGWINGGFSAMSPDIFSYIEGDHTNLEKDTYPILCEHGKLRSVFHDGFWRCCDTKRDLDELSELYEKDGEVWLK